MKYGKSIFSILLFVFFINCTNRNSEPADKNSFKLKIEQKLPEAKVVDAEIIEFSELFETGSSQSMAWGNDHLIITDYNENQLFLFSMNGDLVHKTGGHGKGPDEFESISQLYRGPGQSLYVLDLLQRRINRYEVSKRKFKYITSFTPKLKENYYLSDIYVTEIGNYAVFNHVLDYRQTGEDINYLYLLDEDFQPVKKLLEMPGESKTQMDNGFFFRHPLPNRMLWTLENGYFYILNSHETTVSRRNLKTGETEEFRYLPEFTWINNRATTEFFLNWLEPVIKVVPNTYDAIVESETVPLNSKLLVQGDWIIIKTTYAGSNTGTLIFVNQNKGNAFYGNVPPNYIPFSMIDQSIFGIDFTDLDNVRVKRITFELTDRGTF